jgi:hypothetical protein
VRDNIGAITYAAARSAGGDVLEAGGEPADVARAAMRAASEGFLAPTESEAFAAAVAALWQLYPDDGRLRQETRAIGDANKTMGALLNGVPVAVDLLDLTPMPDDAIGLVDLWLEVRT